MPIELASSIFLNWFNFGGNIEYTSMRHIDSSNKIESIKKNASLSIHAQWSWFKSWKTLKHPNIFAGSIYGIFSTNGNNSKTLQEVEISNPISSSNNSTISSQSRTAYLGNLIYNSKYTGGINASIAKIFNKKFLLGFGVNYYYSILDNEDSKNNKESELILNLAVGKSNDENVYNAISNIQFTPYFKFTNVGLDQEFKYSYGVDLKIPFSTFAHK